MFRFVFLLFLRDPEYFSRDQRLLTRDSQTANLNLNARKIGRPVRPTHPKDRPTERSSNRLGSCQTDRSPEPTGIPSYKLLERTCTLAALRRHCLEIALGHFQRFHQLLVEGQEAVSWHDTPARLQHPGARTGRHGLAVERVQEQRVERIAPWRAVIAARLQVRSVPLDAHLKLCRVHCLVSRAEWICGEARQRWRTSRWASNGTWWERVRRASYERVSEWVSE